MVSWGPKKKTVFTNWTVCKSARLSVEFEVGIIQIQKGRKFKFEEKNSQLEVPFDRIIFLGFFKNI